MLAIGLLVVLVATIVHFGGPAPAVATLAHVGPVQLVPPAGGSVLSVIEAWAIPVCGSVVATELVGRVIATRSPEVARRSSFLAAAMYLAVGLIPVIVGLLGQRIAPGLADAEQLVPTVARELLPTVLYAVFAGGLISAILSTVDSTLLVSAGIFSHNLVVPTLRVRDERSKVRIARAAVVAFGCIAYALALRAEGVFALVEQASSFGSAGILVTVSFALFSRLGGPRTAAATLTAGMVSYFSGVIAGFLYPFLLSLGTALGVYLAGALVERIERAPRAA
jgi:Na+/proline symporter